MPTMNTTESLAQRGSSVDESHAKIQQLFLQRQLPRFIASAGIDRGDVPPLVRDLASLQRAIYQLDCLGERSWRPAGESLREAWDRIVTEANRFGSATVATGLSEIRAYQEIERHIRTDIPVSAVDIDLFYAAKTCDVRMMRRLVLSRARHAGDNQFLSAAWDEFDVVSEVCDDMEDLLEDVGTLNGNRLLCAASHTGVSSAVAQYTRYLNYKRRLAANRAEHRIPLEVQRLYRDVAALAHVSTKRLEDFRDVLAHCVIRRRGSLIVAA